jgi:4-hydroxy-3-polyprenylbenzoate decarboxylase
MNAMWGAGQMMFNKILVLADQDTDIRNYLGLAKTVFKNLNPTTDIYFSQGPMDVLDHSCSKLGFGGKMCIDGTKKFDEEIDDHWQSHHHIRIDSSDLLAEFPEIRQINTSLTDEGIACVLVSVQKSRRQHIRFLHEQLLASGKCEGIKMILYVEHTVDVSDLGTALWRFCNNLDPKRDGILSSQYLKDRYTSCIGLDGTRKTKELDDFNRDWPNIIVADEETIKSVDAKWEQLHLGSFIPSPSLRFRDQLYGTEAAVQ